VDLRRTILFLVIPLLEIYRKKFEPSAAGLIWDGGETLSPLHDRLSEAVTTPLHANVYIPDPTMEEYDQTTTPPSWH
jgi:hypothetical protein